MEFLTLRGICLAIATKNPVFLVFLVEYRPKDTSMIVIGLHRENLWPTTNQILAFSEVFDINKGGKDRRERETYPKIEKKVSKLILGVPGSWILSPLCLSLSLRALYCYNTRFDITKRRDWAPTSTYPTAAVWILTNMVAFHEYATLMSVLMVMSMSKEDSFFLLVRSMSVQLYCFRGLDSGLVFSMIGSQPAKCRRMRDRRRHSICRRKMKADEGLGISPLPALCSHGVDGVDEIVCQYRHI